MIKLMTCEEIDNKLAEGEDPLDVTVLKWNRVIKYLEMASGKVINREYLETLRYRTGGNTCALCKIYRNYGNQCRFCPYLLFHGETCEGLYPYGNRNKKNEDDVETSIEFFTPPPPWSEFRHSLYTLYTSMILCQKSPVIIITNSSQLMINARAMRDKLVEIQKG